MQWPFGLAGLPVSSRPSRLSCITDTSITGFVLLHYKRAACVHGFQPAPGGCTEPPTQQKAQPCAHSVQQTCAARTAAGACLHGIGVVPPRPQRVHVHDAGDHAGHFEAAVGLQQWISWDLVEGMEVRPALPATTWRARYRGPRMATPVAVLLSSGAAQTAAGML